MPYGNKYSFYTSMYEYFYIIFGDLLVAILAQVELSQDNCTIILKIILSNHPSLSFVLPVYFVKNLITLHEKSHGSR